MWWEGGRGLNEETVTKHPVICFHFRKVGLLLQGAVCIRRANASICPIDALSKITSIEVRRTTPASGKTFGRTGVDYRIFNVRTGSTEAGKYDAWFREGQASRGCRDCGKIREKGAFKLSNFIFDST